MAIEKNAKIEWKSNKKICILLSNRSSTFIHITGGGKKTFQHVIIGTGDVIIIELNLFHKKVKFSFKDIEYESILSEKVPDVTWVLEVWDTK